MGTPHSSPSLSDEIKNAELRKLNLECEQLGLPWWRKPAYLGAIVPVILAIGTISVAFLSGRIQAEMDKLDANAKFVQIKKAQYENDKADLNHRAEKIKNLEATLTDKKLANEVLAQEIGKKSESLKIQKAELDKKEKELERRRQEYVRAKKKLRLAGIDGHLNALLDASEENVTGHSSNKLLSSELERLSDLNEGVSIIEGAIIESSDRPILQATLLRILWQVTKSPQWRKALFAIVGEDPERRDGEFWWSFVKQNSPAWDSQQAETLLRELVSVMPENASGFQGRGHLIAAIESHLGNPTTPGKYEKVIFAHSNHTQEIKALDPKRFPGGLAGYLRVFSFCRQIALDSRYNAYERNNALDLLHSYSPLLHIVIVARIVTTTPINARDRQLFLYLNNHHLEVFGHLDQSFRLSFSVPTTTDGDWQAWLSRGESNEAIRFARASIADSDDKHMKDPDLLNGLMEKFMQSSSKE